MFIVRMRAVAALLAVSAMAVLCNCSRNGAFEDSYAQMEETARSDSGAAYAQQLGAILQSDSDFGRSFETCFKKADEGPMRGYLEIDAVDQVKVVFESDNDLSSCMSKAFSGHPVPPPPRVPYFIRFDKNQNK